MSIQTFKIADLILAIDAPASYIHKDFEYFAWSGAKEPQFTISIMKEVPSFSIDDYLPMIDTELLKIYDTADRYMLYYPQEKQIKRSFINKEKTIGTIYVTGSAPDDTEALEQFSYTICLAIRDLFFVFMQKHDRIAVHSASIIYNDKAYVFSASSGVGKTTHTNLWKKLYDIEFLDGDVAALFKENDTIYAYGLPWCGTSKLFQNKKVPLGGIFFLSQSCHNAVHKLTLFEAILRLSARCFTPTWTPELADKNIKIAETIASQTLCAIVACLPNEEAAKTVKDFIDQTNSKE